MRPIPPPPLRDAGIAQIVVPAATSDAWKSVAGITVEAGDLQKRREAAGPHGQLPHGPGVGVARAMAGFATAGDSCASRKVASITTPPAKRPALAAAEAFCLRRRTR